MNRRKEILKFMDTQAYRPLTQEELIEHFLIDDIEEIKDFSKTLNEMEEKGTIVSTRKMRYGLPKHMNLVVGRIRHLSR